MARAKVKVRHLVLVATGIAGGLWLLLPPTPPSPPDFRGQGFASVHAHFPGDHDNISGEERAELARVMRLVPPADGSSGDADVVAELAEVLRSGRPVEVCRCAVLGSLEFRRPDGSAERVHIVPAHDDGSVEFRAGKGRFRVSRERFLQVVAPLRVPVIRWSKRPDPDPPTAPVFGP